MVGRYLFVLAEGDALLYKHRLRGIRQLVTIGATQTQEPQPQPLPGSPTWRFLDTIVRWRIRKVRK
jgi:hypothetical protein